MTAMSAGRLDLRSAHNQQAQARGDPALCVRAFRPGDERLVEAMTDDLSARSLYRRFFSGTPRVPYAVLRQLAAVDHDRTEVVLGFVGDGLVGWAQYERLAGTDDADFAVIVADRWQRQGVGRLLVEQLSALATARGITHFTAVVLADNRPAIRAVSRIWPTAIADRDGNLATFRMPLTVPAELACLAC
jgi:GNAT superfamily N-acetyltransferase